MALISVDEAQAMVSADGHFSPWIADLGLRIERIDKTGVRARLPRSVHIQRPGGVVMGQALMATADTLLVLAFSEALGRKPSMATVSLTTNFMRAAVDCDVIAEARALKLGRSTVFGEVVFSADGDDKPVGQATAVFAVLPDDASAKFTKVGTPIGG
jgi:uncharacterized protein (TIGR00369 family)